MKTLKHALIATLALGLIAGCGSTDRQVRTAQMDDPGMKDMGASSSLCPMDVPGAMAEVQDTTDGVAIILTTDRGDVQELQSRARHLANSYQQRFMSDTAGTEPMEDPDYQAEREYDESLDEPMDDEPVEHDTTHEGTEHHGDQEPMDHAQDSADRFDQSKQANQPQVIVMDTPRGATITLLPSMNLSKETLRSQIQADVSEMANGRCPEMRPIR